MDNEEIELRVHGMSSVMQPANAYALVLEEVYGYRKLPVIIGAQEAQAIKVMMMGIKVPRPLTHDLLQTAIDRLGGHVTKILIYKVRSGIYYSYIFIEKENGDTFQIDSRTSDAIALALRCGCPICTTEEIMASERLYEVNGVAFTVSVNVVNAEMLQDALEKAVKEENYEQAARLRDEIERRKQEKEAESEMDNEPPKDY
ncbi:MAG: DUF151 domain-containing protein [Bacteroidales bacterium]|nr:DUF151 domain-containing protein [Bacteroidales bacterium]